MVDDLLAFEIPYITESGYDNGKNNVILSIVQKIGEFFASLTQKITEFVVKNRIEGLIRKIERIEDHNPAFRNYKVRGINIKTYATLYDRLMKDLNDLNSKAVDNDYQGKVNTVTDNYARMVLGLTLSSMRVSEIAANNYEVLLIIRENGYKSYPTPSNEIIARAYIRAANECGKLVSSSIHQLADTLNSNKMRRFFNDVGRIMR